MNSTVLRRENNWNWFSSSETKKLLGISDCHLMHKRLSGEIIFHKKGNKFFYLLTHDTKQKAN